MRVTSLRTLLLVGLGTLFGAPSPGAAQVYKDLAPVDLVYRIELDGKRIGDMEISFHPKKTERGPRLEIDMRREYELDLTNEFPYEAEAHLVCDEEGLRSFTAESTAGELHVKHTGVLAGPDYRITSELQGRVEKKTITSGVRRTNLGMFCAGFLAEPLDEGPVIQDWPWLTPVVADHQPRQLVRESRVLREYPGVEGKVPVMMSSLRRLDKNIDKMIHTAEGHQILLELHEQIPYGTLSHILETVNGVVPYESGLLK
jgi:hypothetical protein